MTATPADASAERVRSLVERTVFTPVRPGSTVAETVARLGQAIGMGLLRPGERLPTETRLADDLGISPVTLRNALTILREAGLIETQRGRVGGTFVATGAGEASFVADRTLPTESELRDLADYRAVVEGGAAALAAERATSTQQAELDRVAGEMEELEAFGGWSERDTVFHLLLADASGSARIVEQVAGIRAEVYRVSQVLPTPGPVLELANREHRTILRALAARKPDRARTAMTRHVESTLGLWLGLGRVT
jgi:DNA-binding FadR family transcriptional regulator